jgi:hypothetical protein
MQGKQMTERKAFQTVQVPQLPSPAPDDTGLIPRCVMQEEALESGALFDAAINLAVNSADDRQKLIESMVGRRPFHKTDARRQPADTVCGGTVLGGS